MWIVFVHFYENRMGDHRREIVKRGQEQKRLEGELEGALREEEHLAQSIHQLDLRLDQTLSIYNASLTMSSTLEFREKLFSYVKTAGEFQGFRKLFLVVTVPAENEEQAQTETAAFYYSEERRLIQQYPLGPQEEMLIAKLREQKRIGLFTDIDSLGLPPGSFGIEPEKHALIVPLFFHNEFLGALLYCNESEEYQEPLELLSMHFSMELHQSLLYGRIKYLSTIDNLSGAYLKRHFFPLFEEEILRHRESEQELGLLMVDIDHFKKVNDRHGHLAGDHVIREVGRALKESCREQDLIGRFGGDEFLVVLPRTPAAMAYHVALRLQKNIGDLVFHSDTENEFQVNVSIGVAVYPEDGKNARALVEAVDGNLYSAKEKGRNCIVTGRSENGGKA
jgi:diguanylate cyclase (GGDEF)-like protein